MNFVMRRRGYALARKLCKGGKGMADIELVIKISEDSYKATCKGLMLPLDVENVVNAIKTGTPLPKGHGRIMDVDKVIKKMEEREEKLKDDRSIWETAGVETALDMFGETIIEPDKEESEKEREGANR